MLPVPLRLFPSSPFPLFPCLLLLRQNALEEFDRHGVAGAAQDDEGLPADFGLGVCLGYLDEQRDGLGGGASSDGDDGLQLQLRVGVRAAHGLLERAERLLARDLAEAQDRHLAKLRVVRRLRGDASETGGTPSERTACARTPSDAEVRAMLRRTSGTRRSSCRAMARTASAGRSSERPDGPTGLADSARPRRKPRLSSFEARPIQ